MSLLILANQLCKFSKWFLYKTWKQFLKLLQLVLINSVPGIQGQVNA